MRRLVLEYYVIRPPPAFIGFYKLITLRLWQVTISSELLESLITHNSLLENLDILSVILDHIQVNALNLDIKYISLKDVPLLEKLSFWEEEP